MRNLPEREAVTHFLLCGTVGSGKTTTIQLLLQSIAPRFETAGGKPEQLIIFDAKLDIIPRLAALGFKPPERLPAEAEKNGGRSKLWILNPYDRRSAVWKIAEAVQEPGNAWQFAMLLIPEERQTTARYFYDAARLLVVACILGLNKIRGPEWTFRDLLCALDSEPHITKISARDPRAKIIADGIKRDSKDFGGVMSTLATKLAVFEQAAALWHNNDQCEPLSIHEFLRSNGILVLGHDPVLKDTLWPINALFLRAVTQEIMRLSETRTPRHWFILDEFRSMEQVDCIPQLLNLGRSKGVSVLIGVQSVAGLTDVYGEHRAEEILGLCTNKTFFRSGDPRTAQWASNYFGQSRIIENSWGESSGPGGVTSSVNSSIVDRPTFLPSFFLDLPMPKEGGPFMMVSDVPGLKTAFVTKIKSDAVFSMTKTLTEEEERNVIAYDRETDIEAQKLVPWGSDEELLYCSLPEKGVTTDTKGNPSGNPESTASATNVGSQLELSALINQITGMSPASNANKGSTKPPQRRRPPITED